MTMWQITWCAGPDAGGSMVVAPGRMLVGRAPQAQIRCDDPALEPFHAEVLLGSDGTWTVLQLAGRTPVRCTASDIELGASVVRLVCRVDRTPDDSQRRDTSDGASAGYQVVRSPRVVVPWAPEPLAPPPDAGQPEPGDGIVRNAAATLVPAAVACGAAAVMAVVMHQVVMAVFAAVGLLASGVGVAVQAGADRRRRRATQARAAASLALWQAAATTQCAAWAAHERAAHGTAADRFRSVLRDPPTVWQRRRTHGDACVVTLGEGIRTWRPVLASTGPSTGDSEVELSTRRVEGLPVPVDLGPGAVLMLRGVAAAALARSLVMQLACQTGPADWRLVVVTSTPERWAWVAHLPHADDPDRGAVTTDERGLAGLVVAAGRNDAGPTTSESSIHTVVVTDEPALLTVRTGPLRRLLASPTPPGIVVVADAANTDPGVASTASTVPAVCTAVVDTRTDGWARVVADTSRRHDPVLVRYSGLGVVAAERIARRLGMCRDPEDPRQEALDIPANVALLDVLRDAGTDPLDPVSILSGWASHAIDSHPATPLGRTADGRIDIDLVTDGPHGLLAGTTGAGKSELLRSLVLGLACRVPPEQLALVLIDYKGGATFDLCARLPHVAGVVTDLDGRLAERVLRSLRAELARREHLVRDLGASDLTTARRQGSAPVFARLVVVVDEFAALASEQPEFLHALVGVAQRGRSLGVHLLLATQRPAGVIDDDIRANTQLRLALRLHDRADALDVVGDLAPALIPRRVPGRAVLRLGADELVTFQTATAGDDAAAIVAAVLEAAEQRGGPRAQSPWTDPLPNELSAADLSVWLDDAPPPGTVGVIDLPDEQRREPLRWRPADGHLLVLGAPGAGVTSTLATVVSAVFAHATPGRDVPTEFVVFDAIGDDHWDALAGHPRCAGVVRVHERERLWRALSHVEASLDRFDDEAPSLVVIDGIGALRRELDDIDRLVEYEMFERLIAHAGGRVVLAVGADTAATVPGAFVAHCSTRWVLHLHDRSDAPVVGVPAQLVPPPLAGRLVVAGRANEAQLVAPGTVAHLVESSGAVPSGQRFAAVRRIGTLAHRVDQCSLPRSTRNGGSWWPVLGVDANTLDVAVGEIPDAEHLLVLGPARSGRTSTLVRLATAWREADDTDGLIEVVAPRPTRRAGAAVEHVLETALDRVIGALATGRRCLIVIDDAELVTDHGGHLAAIVASADPALTVVAAGRAEPLRQTYGHWTATVRRSRLGVVAAAARDLDGDLIGATLPRRLPIGARPGLGHLVDHVGCRLVQVAMVPNGADPSDQLAAVARAGSLQV
jgi:S-DNA-T family DNA segregation ATPase FtsK/SpoIIIE